uniref:SEA domain-containing protein n=1 Tax=Parascaris univalens TaxID=6257 RepID=A0A915CC94_PARUN
MTTFYVYKNMRKLKYISFLKCRNSVYCGVLVHLRLSDYHFAAALKSEILILSNQFAETLK